MIRFDFGGGRPGLTPGPFPLAGAAFPLKETHRNPKTGFVPEFSGKLRPRAGGRVLPCDFLGQEIAAKPVCGLRSGIRLRIPPLCHRSERSPRVPGSPWVRGRHGPQAKGNGHVQNHASCRHPGVLCRLGADATCGWAGLGLYRSQPPRGAGGGLSHRRRDPGQYAGHGGRVPGRGKLVPRHAGRGRGLGLG